MLKQYLKLMRVHHYIKNLLVFAALICSGELFRSNLFLSCLIGFFAFCFISSVVYILNDLRDVEKDRNHPIKCRRPIASGTIAPWQAWITAAVLLVVASALLIILGSWKAGALLALYLVLNMGYSFGLKDVPLIDITILTAGFLIRVLFGATLAGIQVSNWLYLTVMTLAMYFSLGKRRNEHRKLKDSDTRKVLKAYPIGFLDKSMWMCLGLANVFYALWCIDSQTIAAYHTDRLAFTVPIVLLITLKYSMNLEGESDGDPVEVLLHDWILLGLCLLLGVVLLTVLYL